MAPGLATATSSVISPSRKIAFETLRRVEAEGAYASDVLHTDLGANIRPEDAALATELTLGVLRWRGLLDFLIELQTKKPMSRLDLAVALALRIGLYQLRFLQRIPARAAVNESVELVKHARKSSAASLVNAVLRRMATEAGVSAESLVPRDLPIAGRLALLHSHPQWLVDRWLSRFGETRTIALLEANNRTPYLTVSVHDPAQRDTIILDLQAAGLSVKNGSLLKAALAVSGGSPARTAAFRAGQISIQDEASQTIPLLLGVQPGNLVLDVCAAPGGKTPPFARAVGAQGLVIATDFYAHRMRAMRAQFERLGLLNILLVQLDAPRPLPFGVKFDRILVDAPCSGTGTLARHPEIRWSLRPEKLAEFHSLQVEILRTALASLGPRGRLVYSTCSLEFEENEEVVDEALRQSPTISRVPANATAVMLQPYLAPGVEARLLVDDTGLFRTFPADSRTDGFFAVILEKK
jgi:16S rRNA (cytosine967-C5)-methyltransferase